MLALRSSATVSGRQENPALQPISVHSGRNSFSSQSALSTLCTTTELPFSSAKEAGVMESPYMAGVINCVHVYTTHRRINKGVLTGMRRPDA